METRWTPQAILKNYPEKVYADSLSRAGYVLANLLIVVAVAVFLSTFVVGMDLVSIPFKIFQTATRISNLRALPTGTGVILGLISHFVAMLFLFFFTLGLAFLWLY